MVSKSEQKRLEAQGAADAATTEAVQEDPAGVTELEAPKEYPPIVRKQADRLLKLFQLPEGHEGRKERIAEYQAALVRSGIEEPPLTLLGAQLLVDEAGEYRG